MAWRGIYYRKDGICYLSGISGYLRPGDRLAVTNRNYQLIAVTNFEILGAPDSQMDTLLRVIANRDMGGEVRFFNIILFPVTIYSRECLRSLN